MSEQILENELQEKGLNAPRLTPSAIDAVIKAEDYYLFPGSLVTVCCLTLSNGFTTIGHAACVSPENFDAEIGKSIAKENARNQIWALEGYLLKERLSKGLVTSSCLKNQ